MTNLKFVMFMAAAACAVNGCTAFGPAPLDEPVMCSPDDEFSCTDGFCLASGAVLQVPQHDRCPAGGSCNPAMAGHDAAGCVAAPRPVCPGCVPDTFTCTQDFCDAVGVCHHDPIPARCPGATCRATAADGTSGCYAPPVVECSSASDCDDHVACTVNACIDGACTFLVDHTECTVAGQTCDADAGCVSTVPPPPAGPFSCILAAGSTRIGYIVRVCARGMTGVRTVPDSASVSRPMVNSALRLWSLGPVGAELDAPAGGCVDYNLGGRTGGINTHPYITRWRVGTFDPADERDILNVADLRPFHGHAASDIGLEAYVCQNPSGCVSDADWVALPSEFYRIEGDTTAGASGTYYCDGGTTSSILESSLCNQVPERAVLRVSCTADSHVAR